MATNQGVTALVPDQERVSSNFLLHVVDGISRELFRLSSGTTFAEISPKRLASIVVPFPHISEQRRIAEVLDTLDERIDRESKISEKLVRTRNSAVLRELRQIEGCGSTRLEEIATVERGRFVARPRNDPRFYGGIYPFIQTGDITRASSKVIFEATQSLNEDGRRMSREFPAGTIAVTIAANIGETSILGRPMCFPDSVVGVIASEGVSTRFLEICIRQLKPVLDGRAPQSAQKKHKPPGSPTLGDTTPVK